MTTLTFTIPKGLWMSLNDRIHHHDRARRTKAVRQIGYVTARQARIGPQPLCHVAAFISYPRNGRADPMNTAPVTKALIDGMVDAGIWPDDDDLHVIGPTHLRDPSTKEPGTYRVRMVLTRQEVPW